MKLNSVFRATFFRLAFLYMLLFGISVLFLLGYIYWASAGFMNQQSDETIEAEIQGLAEHYGHQGLPGLIEVINARARNSRAGGLYLVTDWRFRPMAGNLDRWPKTMDAGNGWLAAKLVDEDGEERWGRFRRFKLQGNFHLLVGRDITDRRRIQLLLKRSLFMGLGITLFLGLAGGLAMSRTVLGRIDAVNRTGREIMEGDLSRRVPVSGSGDEFDQLALNLNRMLDRIEKLMTGIRQVSDNIAHDLRTPLTRVRGRIEQALAGDEAELREGMEHALVEIDGLLRTFHALLRIAKAEAGSGRESMEILDMSALMLDLGEFYEPLAEEKSQRLIQEVEDGVRARGNRHLLSQAVSNLLENAVKYTPEGGEVRLELRRVAGGAELAVRDSGPGIPEEHRERVLERFYRLEDSRTTPGSGLGLSLVAAVADFHDALLTLGDNDPGLAVRMLFPNVAESVGS